MLAFVFLTKGLMIVNPNEARVLTFFGEPIYSLFSRANTPRVALDAPDAMIESAAIAHQAIPDRERILVKEPDVLALMGATVTLVLSRGAIGEVSLGAEPLEATG
jgi:hypothetical protein